MQYIVLFRMSDSSSSCTDISIGQDYVERLDFSKQVTLSKNFSTNCNTFALAFAMQLNKAAAYKVLL